MTKLFTMRWKINLNNEKKYSYTRYVRTYVRTHVRVQFVSQPERAAAWRGVRLAWPTAARATAAVASASAGVSSRRRLSTRQVQCVGTQRAVRMCVSEQRTL